MYALLANCPLIDAVRSSLWVELRLWEGRQIRHGTVQIPLQALVWLRRAFPRIPCVPLLEKQGMKKVWGLWHIKLLQWYTRYFPSRSYLHLLLVHFHAEVTLRPRPTTKVHQRQVLHTHQSRRKGPLVWLHGRSRGWRVWECLCFLTPPLSMAWRTPCRELREDSPGQVCLYNSRVAKASSRLTSTSNTIPFSSRACTHRCWNYILNANSRPTLFFVFFYRTLTSECSSNKHFIWWNTANTQDCITSADITSTYINFLETATIQLYPPLV